MQTNNEITLKFLLWFGVPLLFLFLDFGVLCPLLFCFWPRCPLTSKVILGGCQCTFVMRMFLFVFLSTLWGTWFWCRSSFPWVASGCLNCLSVCVAVLGCVLSPWMTLVFSLLGTSPGVSGRGLSQWVFVWGSLRLSAPWHCVFSPWMTSVCLLLVFLLLSPVRLCHVVAYEVRFGVLLIWAASTSLGAWPGMLPPFSCGDLWLPLPLPLFLVWFWTVPVVLLWCRDVVFWNIWLRWMR